MASFIDAFSPIATVSIAKGLFIFRIKGCLPPCVGHSRSVSSCMSGAGTRVPWRALGQAPGCWSNLEEACALANTPALGCRALSCPLFCVPWPIEPAQSKTIPHFRSFSLHIQLLKQNSFAFNII